MFNAVFYADSHLTAGGIYSGRRPEIYGDAYSSLSQIYNYAITQKVDMILDGGDLNDFKIADPDQLTFLSEQNDLLRQADIKVKVIHGNHDKPNNWNSQGTSYFNILSQFDWVHDQMFEVGPLIGYGLDYQGSTQETKRYLDKLDPHVTLLLVHQALDLVALHNCNMKHTDVPSHVQQVLAGDQHVEFHRKVNDTDFYYSGSTYLRRFSEPAKKSFLHLTIADDGSVTTKRVPIETRPFINRTLETEDDVVELLNTLDAAVESAISRCTIPETTKPFLQIKYNPDLHRSLSVLREAGSKHCHLFLRQLPKYVQEADETANAMEQHADATPSEILSKMLEHGSDSYDFAMQLIQGNDVSVTMEHYKAKYGLSETPGDDLIDLPGIETYYT